DSSVTGVQTCALPILHRANQVVDAPLPHELVVERRVERDGDAVHRGDRRSVSARALDEHLVRLELVTGRAEAPAAEILEVASLEIGRGSGRGRGEHAG